jgi:hypothetical protein
MSDHKRCKACGRIEETTIRQECEARMACPSCGDMLGQPCKRCATYGTHGGDCRHQCDGCGSTEPAPIHAVLGHEVRA